MQAYFFRFLVAFLISGSLLIPGQASADQLSDQYCPAGTTFHWSTGRAHPGDRCGDAWTKSYECRRSGVSVKKGLYTFPGKNDELCTPQYPLTFELLSTSGKSTVPAGAKDVQVASVLVAANAENADGVRVERLSGLFSGAPDALTECVWQSDGRVLSDTFTPEVGVQTTDFRTPLLVLPGKRVPLAVSCAVAGDALGKSYQWGIELNDQGTVLMGKEILPPRVLVGRRPDGRPGTNGVRFTVISPEISRDQVLYSKDVRTNPASREIASDSSVAVSVEVKNDGATVWLPNAYALTPANQLTRTWMGDVDRVPLRSIVQPGASTTFTFLIRPPKNMSDARAHLSWFLERVREPRYLLQDASLPKLALRVVEEPHAPQPPEEPASPSIREAFVSLFVGTPEPSVVVVPSEQQPATPEQVAPVDSAPAPGENIPAVSPGENPTTPQEEQQGQASSSGVQDVGATSTSPLPVLDGVLDPIEAVTRILQELFALGGEARRDYPKLREQVRVATEQFSSLTLAAKKSTLERQQGVIEMLFPVGRFAVRISPQSVVGDFSIGGDIFPPEKIVEELALHPLPTDFKVVGEVLMGEIHVVSKDVPATQVLNQPIEVEIYFEDKSMQGWSWDQSSLCVYRAGGAMPVDQALLARCPTENSSWRPLENVRVQTFSKNLIVVSVQPSDMDLGTIVLAGKRLPLPESPQSAVPSTPLESQHTSAAAPLFRASNAIASIACSWTSFFGWPLPRACE